MSNVPEIVVASDSQLYRGVLSRRVLAFVVDYLFVAILCIPAAVILSSCRSLRSAWDFLLFPALFFIVAALYFGLSLGGRSQSTPGMRMAGIAIRQINGQRMDFMTAMVHLVLFWIINSVLTPFILLAGLFTDHNRLVHDLLIGTEAVRTDF